MTRIKAYLRLVKWRWTKNNQDVRPIHVYAEQGQDEDIIDFDLRPYLGWMEEELEHKSC